MKTINSLRSKLLVITLALMASVSSFAYDEMPDFQVDGLYYNFLEGDNVEVTHPYRPEMPTEGTSTTATQDLYDDYAELTELTIPSTISYEGKVYNVIRIGYAAFDQCNLTYVDIPSSIKTIGVGAFSNCTSLTSITLKEGLEHIEGNAFADCRLLETITFPNSLKTVGSYAFSFTAWYNNQPNGGVYAGNVFYKYKGDIPENTSFVIKEGTVSISPDAFIKENRRIDYGLVAVAIPNSVEIIGEYAFSQCRALRSVNIPSRVTTIESYAFSYCKSLTSVTSEIVEPLSLPSDVFFKASVVNATLYVPAESVEAYKNADQWKDFGQILPIKPTSYKSQWCDIWNVMEHNMGGVDDSETTWRHYLANDTIINGQTYTSVNYYWTLEESKVYKIAHVRFSEDKKVYALMDDTEYLVYDFSVQVGDTIETIVGAFYGSMLQQLLVHQIDIDEETNRKTIILFPICKCDEDLYCLFDLPIIWIEGVGTTDGFLMGYPPCDWVGGIGCDLLCAYKDDELKYTGSLYEKYGCEYNATEQKPEDLFPTLWGLQRTSFTEYSECSDSYASLFQSKGETITINYNQYLKFGGHYLREENKQVLLYSRLQDKDLVLYDYSLEVGDTLTTLNIDYRIEGIPFDLCYVDYAYEDVGMSHSIDTLIVTDVSYVTLLDGKKHKQWTFDNGMQYVEGIGNFGQSRWSGNFFGLVKEPAIPPCLMGEHLVCVSKNNKLLYQMDEAEMERLGAECLCDYNSGPKKDNAKNGKIGGRPTPTQWNMLEVETKEMDGTPNILRAETFSYTLENDSIVANNKTYYQLARQSTKDTAITKSFVGALHFGEDEDNRVYFLRDGVEYVLYDFTAEPGDTIEIFAGINNYPQETTYTHVVTGKDTLENGACRMMLEVVFPEEIGSDLEQQHLQKIWLAGLGSIDGIVHNAAKRTSDAHAAPARSAHSSDTQTSVMLCAWREDSCLYTTNHPEYDTFGCVYNQDPTAVENLTSPSSYQKIIHEGTLLILHEGKVYNVIGIQIK